MRYRKKPVVIDAFHVTEFEYHTYVCCGTFANAPDWLRDNTDRLRVSNGTIYVHTLEGDMKIRMCDYLVRGIDGEFYPCREDIFLRTYEVVNDGN